MGTPVRWLHWLAGIRAPLRHRVGEQVCSMPLAPKGGAKPVPPSRLGKFKPEPGSNRPTHRCECCGAEGQDVPTPPKGSTRRAAIETLDI